MKKITEYKIQKLRKWIKDGRKPFVTLRGANEPIEIDKIKMHQASGACQLFVFCADQEDPAKVTKTWGYEFTIDPEDILVVCCENDGKIDDEEDT